MESFRYPGHTILADLMDDLDTDRERSNYITVMEELSGLLPLSTLLHNQASEVRHVLGGFSLFQLFD